MWKTLKSFFFTDAKEPGYVRGPEPVDTEEIANRFNVLSKGAKDGRQDQPPVSATSLNLLETEIVGHFREIGQHAVNFYRDQTLDLDKHVQQKTLKSLRHQTAHIVPTFEAEAESLSTSAKQELLILKEQEHELESEYSMFRRENSLRRSAEYPDSRVLLITVLVMILVIEAVLNGYFFAKASEFGLVGGVMQASITALVNLSFGWFFGRFAFTQINHCNKLRRYTAWFAVPLLYCFVVLFYNLFIGHFRDEIASAVTTGSLQYGQVGTDVLSNIMASPLGLQSFDSWLLVFLGIAFALIATGDGYKFDDRYPGFGKIARRFQQAREDYQEEKRLLKEGLQDLKLDALDKAKRIRTAIEHESRSIQNILTHKTKKDGEAKTYLSDLEQRCNFVLNLYRRSNIEARNSEDYPAYFNDSYDLKGSLSVVPTEEIDLTDIAEQLSTVDEMLKDCAVVSNEIERQYSTYVKKIDEALDEIEK